MPARNLWPLVLCKLIINPIAIGSAHKPIVYNNRCIYIEQTRKCKHTSDAGRNVVFVYVDLLLVLLVFVCVKIALDTKEGMWWQSSLLSKQLRSI